LAEERRGQDPAAARQRELDAQVEELSRQIADVINSAGEENRQYLREYAVELVRERTEQSDGPTAAAVAGGGARFNPLGFAILLVPVSLGLLLLFPPLGLGLLVAAVLMGAWGLIAIVVRRQPS
jgi:hypothetical protein